LLNTLGTSLFEMSVSKVFITTAITAMLIAIATATTAATFPNVAVFATFLGTSEQVGNDTTTDATTTTTAAPPETAGAGQQQQQQQPIHITKDGTNSYVIPGGFSTVGSFDTTYRVVGERSAIRASEDLIITTITDDFSSSPTIGYVGAGNMTTTTTTTTGGAAAAAPEPTLPSPFATQEQITERITSDLRRVITEAENNTPQGQHVEIKCDFGMTLDEMRCHYIPSVGAGGAGALATEAPTAPTTNTTDTTGTEAPTAPIE
jgi:hypothetical protein